MEKLVLLVWSLLFVMPLQAEEYQILHQEDVNGDMGLAVFPMFGELSVGKYLIEGKMSYGSSTVEGVPIAIIDLDAFSFQTKKGTYVDVSISANVSIQMPPNKIDQINYLGLFWQGSGKPEVGPWVTQEVTWGLEAIDVNVNNRITFDNKEIFFFQADTRELPYEGPILSQSETISLNYSILIHVKDVLPIPVSTLNFSGLLALASFLLLSILLLPTRKSMFRFSY